MMVPGTSLGGLLKKDGHFWNHTDLLRKHCLDELILSESRQSQSGEDYLNCNK